MRAANQIMLRRLRESDAESFYGAVRESIAELSYWMPWCYPEYSLDDARAWIKFTEAAWSSQSEYPLGIFEMGTNRVIGGTGINHINKMYRIGNIGYWVSSACTGRGIAKSAALLAADIGFQELALTRLEIVALTHNHASQRVAEAIGAKKECCARNRLYFQGKPHNAVVYSLIPHDVPPQPHPTEQKTGSG